MRGEFKRWAAKWKAALVMDVMQAGLSVAEGSSSRDLPPSGIEAWIEGARKAWSQIFLHILFVALLSL